jgi:hypothetical protein
MIRLQEQAIITVLKPTVNRDNVKFLTQWTPKIVAKPSEANIVVTTTDEITNVTRQVANSLFKGRLTNQLGIGYNTLIAHLNNDTTVWSPAFGFVVSPSSRLRSSLSRRGYGKKELQWHHDH